MSVNTSLPENPLDVKTKSIDIAVPGRTYTYKVTWFTERCVILEAAHTGAVRQFNSLEAMNVFLSGLRTHLRAKELNNRVPKILSQGVL